MGMNPLKDWTMATDEAHSTKFVIKGLKEGERYFVKVRKTLEAEVGGVCAQCHAWRGGCTRCHT